MKDVVFSLLLAVALAFGIADILVIAERMAPEPVCPIDPLTTVFCLLTGREALAAGLIAGAAALVAAWIAWRSVQSQVTAEDRRQRKALKWRQQAILYTAMHAAGDLVVQLTTAPLKAPTPTIIGTLRDLTFEVMTIKPRLGAALSSCVNEMEIRARSISSLTDATPPRNPAFRVHVLANALENAQSDIDADRPVRRPLISNAEMEKAYGKFSNTARRDDLSWVKFLTEG